MFLRHEQCPECSKYGRDRRQNNLGVWTDHKYCFSCGYFEGTNPLEKFKQEQTTPILQCGIDVRLPVDGVFNIPPVPLAWVKQYGITNDEIVANRIGWSESKQLLIFPIYGASDDLLAWIGRYFGPNKDHPKYLTYGIKKELFHLLGTQSNTVVVVEDMVSAIKVSRQECCMPLLSSDINKYQLFRLSKMFDNIVIWLDPDKRQHAIKLSKRAESFFRGVRIVYSDADPKELTDGQIKELLK